jgi:KaiC/GvpD/RAD55 family RecA-like ATPase
MLNETAATIAAWSADVYARRPVKPGETLLGPLTKGCVTLLCGPRGVGKSWLALALAHTAARGGTLGAWRARKSHRVVYVDVAGSEAVLHQRLQALGPKPPPLLTIVPGDAQDAGLPDPSLESGRTALDELTTDADLVVIDGLSALVRKGRGVGERWAALERWLRSLRHRHTAVLVVDAKEPKALTDIADTVLKVDRPADGVQDGDLRLQAKLLSSRPDLEGTQRFELRLDLRRNGAAWTYVDNLDHRAIMAYRLDRAD